MQNKEIIQQIAEAMYPRFLSDEDLNMVEKIATIKALTLLAPFISEWMSVDLLKELKPYEQIEVIYVTAEGTEINTIGVYYQDRVLYHFAKQVVDITESIKQFRRLPSTTHPYEMLLEKLLNKEI